MMAEHSTIQWTDATWNPTTGCTKISPGCANCYIDRTPPFRMAGRKFVGGKIPLIMHADRLDKPLHWRKPKRIFVNSLSDLFHEDVPDAFIDRVFAVMAMADHHVFQVLTKRPERMRDYLLTVQDDDKDLQRFANVACDLAESPCAAGIFDGIDWPFANVWCGVSVENRQHGLPRIEHLRQTPAALRFLSVEPLLEEVHLPFQCNALFPGDPSMCDAMSDSCFCNLIDWVIVGGESGPSARPCNVAWIRSIVEQCKAACIPVFIKQLGARPISPEPQCPIECDCGLHHGFRDKKGADISEFPLDLRVREFPPCKHLLSGKPPKAGKRGTT